MQLLSQETLELVSPYFLKCLREGLSPSLSGLSLFSNASPSLWSVFSEETLQTWFSDFVQNYGG